MFPKSVAADLVKFTEEILNGKLLFLCSNLFGKLTRNGLMKYGSPDFVSNIKRIRAN